MAKTDIKTALINYSTVCMKVCAQQSEQAVGLVGQILDSLMQDASRVSKMSEDTISALKRTRAAVSEKIRGDGSVINRLVEALKKISHEHHEIDSFVMPIIESLQFQDRTRQQMENLAKMLLMWIERRAKITDKSDIEKELLEFGSEVMKITTTDEERVAIRAAIPNLPESKSVDSGDMYF